MVCSSLLSRLNRLYPQLFPLRFHADTLTGSQAREHLDVSCVVSRASGDEPPLLPVTLADHGHKLKLSDPLHGCGRNPQPLAVTSRYLYAAEHPG